MSKPIETDNMKLVIRPEEMEVGKGYEFDYAGVEMVAVKSSGGAIDLYQVLDKVAEVIDKFEGKHRFLSNFYRHNPGELTVEHDYQASKTFVHKEKSAILACATAGGARRLGRTVTLRDDWEEAKLAIMEILVRKKFRNPDLQEKLLATGDKGLVEGNWWGDRFWGVCQGEGKNHLGKILMKIRGELQSQQEGESE